MSCCCVVSPFIDCVLCCRSMTALRAEAAQVEQLRSRLRRWARSASSWRRRAHTVNDCNDCWTTRPSKPRPRLKSARRCNSTSLTCTRSCVAFTQSCYVCAGVLTARRTRKRRPSFRSAWHTWRPHTNRWRPSICNCECGSFTCSSCDVCRVEPASMRTPWPRCART